MRHLLQKEGDSVVFEYDYGDSWNHLVTLKAKSDYAAGEKKVVRLTDGANACPPDDCGGIWRYNHLVQLMKEKPRSRELREFYDWLGSKWNPSYFPKEVAARAVEGQVYFQASKCKVSLSAGVGGFDNENGRGNPYPNRPPYPYPPC